MASHVLDRTAIVAVLRREKGAEKVIPHLYGGLVSAVTVAELMKQAALHGAEIGATIEALRKLNLEIVPFTEDDAFRLAAIASRNNGTSLSFTDMAVLSLAIKTRSTVLTANDALIKHHGGAKVRLFRK